MADLTIVLVPALSDNYVFLVHDPDSGETAAIDPSEPAPVLDALAERGWRLTHILNTHHHYDHTGGNEALKDRTGARIIGAHQDARRLPGLDDGVQEGDIVRLGSHQARVIETPGHTSGHIAFWVPKTEPMAGGALFCGDTLFSLGCGRLFEGTPAQMWDSLCKLRALPPDTRVFCAHEYTQSNARFALSVDPDNAALQARAAEVDRLRARNEPTIPALLSDEIAANPFLRADNPALAARLGRSDADPVAVLADIRNRKDRF